MHDFKKELEFLTIAENLKKALRHSWLSDHRQESVAEHSWRLALMAFRYHHKLDQPVDLERCLLMAIIHDLAEAITGDIPTFLAHKTAARAAKLEAELEAMRQIQSLLDDDHGNNLFKLWQEYEDQQCYESRFVRALDKLEAFIQHNHSPLNSWGDHEKRMVFQDKWLMKHCRFDSFLSKMAEVVLQESINKLLAANEDIEKFRQEALAEEKRWLQEEA